MPAAYESHLHQLELILRAWGMKPVNAAITAEIMAYADLHGIDSHGISMIPSYDQRRRAGKMSMTAEPKIIHDRLVAALIDGGGGLGHVNSYTAMNLAISKARTLGVGIVAVRNSAHFGACGYYARMAAHAGFIGMVTTSASGIQVAPTGGAEAKYGTDPIAFAAPDRDGEPFLLDMATTTVAAGRIRNKANENLPTPPGRRRPPGDGRRRPRTPPRRPAPAIRHPGRAGAAGAGSASGGSGWGGVGFRKVRIFFL
jgi:LDH2 family malate/lactate/ureidoglycolate dehydrogenase